MHSTITFLSVLICLLVYPGGFVYSEIVESDESPSVEIGIDEQLGEFVPLGLNFVDESGDSVVLRDLIDKPTVISLVYFRCPGICSPMLSGVVDVLDRLDMKPGLDYGALTISFNPTETPDLARDKKRNYFKAFNRKSFPEENWKWLTGDSVSIAKITNAVGFRYKKVGNEFAHAGALIVLSSKGKISRYLRGIEFQPFDLKMAITEASKGKTGPTINKLLLYCFSYDPAGRQYVLNITKIAGTAFVLFVIVFFAFLTLKGKIRTKK